MKIQFNVAGRPAEFRWSNMTGSATLRVDGTVVELQSGANLSSHFGVSTTREWRHVLLGHEIVVTKKRPVVLAGFRRNDFTVAVNGTVVAMARGL